MQPQEVDRPIVQLTKYSVKSGYLNHMRQALDTYVLRALMAEGNVMAEAYAEIDNPAVLWLIERWENQQALVALQEGNQAKGIDHLAKEGLTAPAEKLSVTDLEPLSRKDWLRQPNPDLCQSDDITTVDMKSYLAEFLLFLAESFESSDHIRIVQKIDSVKMPSMQAIPLALIINESVTNAFKHAFPGNLEGVIHVSLHQLDDNLLLTVEDNGIGWNEGGYNHQNSLGIQLMKGLSEDLGAQIHFDNHEGTRVSLVMKHKITEDEKSKKTLFA